MQIKIDTTPYANLETDAIVSYVFDETDPIQGTLADIDKSANGLLKKLAIGDEFSGKPLEMTLIHSPWFCIWFVCTHTLGLARIHFTFCPKVEKTYRYPLS